MRDSFHAAGHPPRPVYCDALHDLRARDKRRKPNPAACILVDSMASIPARRTS
jgi:hypothetical protein